MLIPKSIQTLFGNRDMGSVFLATSKSRIEEYLPPNFGQEIVIFPLSQITLKALRIPIICSIARPPSHSSLLLHRSHLGIALIPAHQCFHLGIISLPARWLGNPNFHMVIPVSI